MRKRNLLPTKEISKGVSLQFNGKAFHTAPRRHLRREL